MTQELWLRRKWTFRAHGKQVVLVKKPNESVEHVLLKAFLWALYQPEYPELSVEVGIGDRYKPDVVALGARGEPVFWGEAGHVSPEKIRALGRRYRATHFALARWNSRLEPLGAMVQRALEDLDRAAPFDLLRFPLDSAERFIREGVIQVRFEDVEWLRAGPMTGRMA